MKNAIVTGASNGIGLEISKKLSENGAELALAYQNDTFFKRVKPLAESINAKVLIECHVHFNFKYCSNLKFIGCKLTPQILLTRRCCKAGKPDLPPSLL